VEIIGSLYILEYLLKIRSWARDKQEGEILVFFLLLGTIFALFKMALGYYAIMLFLPVVPMIFTINLDIQEKTLLLISMACICFRPYIEFACKELGGAYQSLVYIFNPVMVGSHFLHSRDYHDRKEMFPFYVRCPRWQNPWLIGFFGPILTIYLS